MDDCETVVYNFLAQRLGFKNVVYEPNGPHSFPDFLVENKIVVEARRLNQNEALSQPGIRPRGLEGVATKVRDTIQRLLPSLGPPLEGVSWYVHVEVRQPVPAGEADFRRYKRRIKNAVRQHLQAFRDGPKQNPTTIPLSDNCVLKLDRAGQNHDGTPWKVCQNYFVMGVCDSDFGGWTKLELQRNLKICIDQKTVRWKASRIPRTKYDEWWLAFIDLINHGREADIKLPPEVPPHNWDKIILINPLNYTQASEIPLYPRG